MKEKRLEDKEDVLQNKEKQGKKIKILAIFKSPAPYFDTLFKLFSQYPEVEFTVCYCLHTTDGETYFDLSINKEVSWGVKLLEGYQYVFLHDELEPVDKNDLKITASTVKKVIKENDYDVILMASSYWSLTTWYAIRAAKKKNMPIVTRMTVEADRKRNPILLLLKKILVGKYCHEMSAGVYECRQQRDYLHKYGMKADRLFAAPCAVDNEYYFEQSKKLKKQALRKEYDIPDDATVFVSTGMLIERKRQKDVIEVLAKLRRANMEPYYIMVGDGTERENYESLITKYGLRNVRITGQLPQGEMCKYLKMADAYVLASQNDASPKALNEAMNFALPIIITTGCGTAELLLEEGENGYIYQPGDLQALEEIMRAFLRTDEESRKKMGRRSLEIVEKCSYNHILEGWLNACKYALENNINERV